MAKGDAERLPPEGFVSALYCFMAGLVRHYSLVELLMLHHNAYRHREVPADPDGSVSDAET